MKRPLTISSSSSSSSPSMADKKLKQNLTHNEQQETQITHLDQDLLFEILKLLDAKSLATASCINKHWNTIATDERLWEMICTRHWANNPGSGNQQQLRSVVHALGGFRRLHSSCLWPLLKPLPSVAPEAMPSSSTMHVPTNWGKDEVHLSLSLMSIRFYEKMNPFYKGRT